MVVLDAVRIYKELTQQQNLIFEVFYKWVYFTHQELFYKPKELQEALVEVEETIKGMTKKDFFTLT